ncbi:PD-(D/E)XK nuclease family protein, partial [bacterium]|nr:PD-(D/E)XK nuclease family protein [bacterium]
MPLLTRFLDWKRPLLASACDLLLGDHTGGLLDLRDTMIIVPTANSGRRLREQLAYAVAKRGGAVLPGAVISPHNLLTDYRGPEAIAGRMETLAAWIAALRQVDPGDLPELFPVVSNATTGAETTLRRIVATATKLQHLRHDLGEQGLSIATVASREDWNHEPERWRELSHLEQHYLEQLSRRGKIDQQLAQLRVAEQPQLPEHIRRVFLLAVPDPLPLALRVLESWSAMIAVEVVIHAPAELRSGFDNWGRPQSANWEDAVIPLPAADIRLADKPAAQADQLLKVRSQFAPSLIDTSGDEALLKVDDLALGVMNPEVIPFLERKLAAAGTAAWNPAGVLCSTHYLTRLVVGFCDLIQQDSYEAFARLARRHTFISLLKKVPQFDSTGLLEQLDTIQNRYLPATFSQLLECTRAFHNSPRKSEQAPDLLAALELLIPLLKQSRESLPEGLRAFLQAASGGRQLHTDRLEDREYALVAEQLAGLLISFEKLEDNNYQLTPGEAGQLLLQELKLLKYQPERQPGCVELEGWLELHWNDVPCLLLSGMNDGFVPETVVGDLFLPDNAREQLGLKNNKTRFARDAYLLSALAASRSGADAGLQLLVGRNSNRGDPLRPSRLLFQCPLPELPERVEQLFGSAFRSGGVSQSPGWLLKPPQLQHGDTLSVTAFRSYLACPFRFYLSRVLKLKEVDDRVRELSPVLFGEMCHKVLELFGRSNLRDSTDEKEIADWLLKQAGSWIHATCGRELTVALQIQLEVARRRLRRAATVQAELRRQGWSIAAVEQQFRGEQCLELEGMQISGTIDRIDRHD